MVDPTLAALHLQGQGEASGQRRRQGHSLLDPTRPGRSRYQLRCRSEGPGVRPLG
jgi:hypothetical protein